MCLRDCGRASTGGLMGSGRRFTWLASAALGCALIGAAPAIAQDDAAEIDALIDATQTLKGAETEARRQQAAGDVPGAAATLERALLEHSEGESDDVRLLYAALLCRLGDKQTAEGEISKLDGRGINDGEWAETIEACGPLARPPVGPGRGREGINGSISAGLTYDSDLAGALFVQFNLPGVPVIEDEGFAFFGAAQLAARVPGGPIYGYATGSAITRNSLSGANVHYQLLDLEMGLGTQTRTFEFSTGVVGRSGIVSGHRLLSEIGVAADVALALGRDSRITFRGEVVAQDQEGSTPALDRDGTRYDAALAIQGRRGSLNYYVGGAYERKESATARTGYSGGRFFVSARQFIPNTGVYGSTYSMLRHVEYGDEAGFPPANELRYYSRLAIGVPIGSSGLAIEGAGSYTRRDYNAASTLKDYSNVGAELRLIWNFGN